jgi:hypothetical protein
MREAPAEPMFSGQLGSHGAGLKGDWFLLPCG